MLLLSIFGLLIGTAVSVAFAKAFTIEQLIVVQNGQVVEESGSVT